MQSTFKVWGGGFYVLLFYFVWFCFDVFEDTESFRLRFVTRLFFEETG